MTRRALVTLVCLLGGACRAPTPSQWPDLGARAKPPTPGDEATADGLAQKARALRAEGRRQEARAVDGRLAAELPGTGAGAEALLREADARQADGDTETAKTLLGTFLALHRGHPDHGRALLRYARLLVDRKEHEEARPILEDLAAASPESPEVQGLLTETKLGGEAPEDALLPLLASASQGRPDALREAVSKLDAATCARLLGRIGDRAAFAAAVPALRYRLARLHYHTRHYTEAKALLEELLAKGAGPYAEGAEALLSRLAHRFTVAPGRVGVLLPLTGPYSPFGQRSLTAIKIALAAHPKVELIVKDTGGDPTTAAAAVESLVQQHHVIAAIGPLFSKTAAAAALKAEELSLPLIVLSHHEGLPQLGENIFQSALTVTAQAEALAEHAFVNLGFRTFAILHPKSHYGTSFAHAFWDAVDQRRGEVRGFESYEHDQTTFQEPIKRLVGRYLLKARDDFRHQEWRLKSQNLPPHRLQAAMEKMVKGLKPLVDFDAIVIPDSPKNLGLIAPALAVEDIVLTHDEDLLKRIRRATKNRDLSPVTLLGASTWNSPLIARNCERYCEDAVFVDGYFLDNPTPKNLDFVAAFKAEGQSPPGLPEAQAYDTAALFARILDRDRPSSREAMRAAIAAARSEGLTGTLTFGPQGEARRKLFVLTVREGQIRDAASPPQG